MKLGKVESFKGFEFFLLYLELKESLRPLINQCLVHLKKNWEK